jgi:hypothetical protein
MAHSQIAIDYLQLKNLDSCYEWLGKMFDWAIENEPPPALPGYVPLTAAGSLSNELYRREGFNAIRDTPRFAALLERVNAFGTTAEKLWR